MDTDPVVLVLRSRVNKWISDTFPEHRKYLSHDIQQLTSKEDLWLVSLCTKNVHGKSVTLGNLHLSSNGTIVKGVQPSRIVNDLNALIETSDEAVSCHERQSQSFEGRNYELILGDGVKGSASFADREIDLLLTDPPYGISKPYTCEQQVPRRLRKDGRDFIMPKGHFGDWDQLIEPSEWLEPMLSKVNGWVVTFCAQAQIGEYLNCLEDNKFVATGTLVWQKTNPVPFNHRFKPINAWEALVCGKRPGSKFNGEVVHNVFLYKSPSPHERIHPTQKPLDLMSEFVSLFSERGDLIYDPFAGSCTTLMAARMLDRKSIGYEADPRMFKLACDRLQGSVL